MNLPRTRFQTPRRAFTLVEMMLAIMVASLVLGAVWTGLGQLSRARGISRNRMNAHLRADAALNEVRRDIASVLRSDDLFWTKLRIQDGLASTDLGTVDRDDLLLFSSRMRLSRSDSILSQGEGLEYETQYRIIDDADGPVLWQRRDAVPDEWYDGGGVVKPIADDIIGFNVEAYDGEEWWDSWDSDERGLPFALRLTVVVPISRRIGERPVILQTVVAIDRVLPPFDAGLTEEELEELQGGGEEGQEPAPAGAATPGGGALPAGGDGGGAGAGTSGGTGGGR